MPGTQRLKPEDVAALRALAAGQTSIESSSRYWLSVYRLIEEAPDGWRVSARGRDYLQRLKSQTRGDVVLLIDALYLALSSSPVATPPRHRASTASTSPRRAPSIRGDRGYGSTCATP